MNLFLIRRGGHFLEAEVRAVMPSTLTFSRTRWLPLPVALKKSSLYCRSKILARATTVFSRAGALGEQTSWWYALTLPQSMSLPLPGV